MEKIGNKQIVYTGSFLVPKEDDVWFSANVDGWQLKMNIRFEEGKTQEVKIRVLQDYAEITLIDWSNTLGTAFVEPVVLGTHKDGRKLYFMMSNFRIGETNKLDIQLLLGGAQ